MKLQRQYPNKINRTISLLTLSCFAAMASEPQSVEEVQSSTPQVQSAPKVSDQQHIMAPVEPKPIEAFRNPDDFYKAHTLDQAKRFQLDTSELKAQSEMEALNTCTNSMLQGYGNQSGSALVQHILNNPSTCIDALFNGGSIAFNAFSANNMHSVAQQTAQLASQYNGTSGTEIGKLYYFLRAGYYVQYYNPEHIPNYPSWVGTSVQSALDNLVNNSSFYTNSDFNGRNIVDALTLIDSAGLNARYLYVVKEWLQRWNQSYAQNWHMRSAVNSIFTILFRGHQNSDFVQAARNDTVLIQRLGSFARSDWMLNSQASFLQENAGGELARFIQYTNAPIYNTVRSELQSLFNRYSMNGTGAAVWLRAAASVDFYGACAQFSICGFQEQLEQQVLSINHSCSPSMRFRAQDMTWQQLNESCNKVQAEEQWFHQFLVTDNQPVANDLNDSLEMVVFDSSNDYGLYAGIFFGIDTNNGGMYLEGNPADPNNQARFIAYEAEWLRPDFVIWNLTHEMVHYLDGRFNMKGGFADYRIGTHKTVWWIEGLAEYVSKKNRNDHAINLARTRGFALSDIMANTYFSGTERIYHWGYLAVRYMFERQPETVNQILTNFRTGQYDTYLSAINSIGSSFDQDWYNWLETVDSNDNQPEITIGGGGGTTPIPGNELQPGVPVTGLSAGQGEWLKYTLDVPANQNQLTVVQSGGSGDADLYVRFGQEPTLQQYDCRPYRSGNNEQCEFTNPQQGRWYVYTRGYSAFNGVSLVANLTGQPTQPGACSSQNPVDYVQVEAGQQYCIVAGQNGDYSYFYLYNTVANARYTFNLYGQGDGNADLYFSRSTWPTAANYELRSVSSGHQEQITTGQLPVGWAYISIHANPNRPQTTLVVTQN